MGAISGGRPGGGFRSVRRPRTVGLPLGQVLEPAIEAAEAGVPVTWDLVLAIVRRLKENRVAARRRRPASPRRPATNDPRRWRPSRRDRRANRYLTTRQDPARDRPPRSRGFYRGWVAESIEREVKAGAGILTADDLAAYQPKITVEAGAWYRGIRYSTASDPVGYEALNILACFDLAAYGPESSEYRHLMAEAMGHAFVDNMRHYGDPDIVPSPVAGLASPEFAASRAAGIRLDRAAPRPIPPGDPWPYQRGCPSPHQSRRGRLHPVSPAPVDGRRGCRRQRRSALITSLTSAFGSLVLVPDGGFFLNNAMRNFDPRPDRANCIAPGKNANLRRARDRAERDGVAFFGAGGSGGYRITSGVLHALINHVDFGMRSSRPSTAHVCTARARRRTSTAASRKQCRSNFVARTHRRATGRDAGTDQLRPRQRCRTRSATGELSAGSSPPWNTAAAGI